MSAQAVKLGEDVTPDRQERPKAPEPLTQNVNNQTTKAIVTDARPDEERIPGMVKESTVWDVYNNEARKVDNELVKDWTASLNFLLLFAAIFAAVLTAFIIESKKMLEPDQTEILVDIAIQYFNNIGNSSRINITRPDFEPTSAAISVNCLLFASLGASLVAALASVVALQWVADYDAAITRGGSSPEDRAKRRQFRHAGVVGWKMSEIIAALPLLLYSSVILFWAGIVQWMRTLHHIIGYVVAGGTAIAVLFYASTTLLGAIYVSSPFRTPLSHVMYWLYRWSLSLVGRFMLWLPLQGFLHFCTRLRRSITSLIRRVDRRTRVRFPESRRPRTPLSEEVLRWIRTHLLTDETSRQREDKTAKQDSALASEALAWLATQLPISADSHERLLLCVGGILRLSTQTPLSPRFYEAPWLAILEVLSKNYMRRILNPTSSTADYEGAEIVLRCIAHPYIRSRVVPGATYEHDPRSIRYWQQCSLRGNALDGYEVTQRSSMTFLLARDVPVPSLGSKCELEATCKLTRWRNSLKLTTSGSLFAWYRRLGDRDIWPEVFSDIGGYSPEFFESCPSRFQMWTNILPQRIPGLSDYTIMFNSIARQALHRALTAREAIAIAQAFAACVTSQGELWFAESVHEESIIPRPLSYTVAVELSPESTRAAHHVITLLLVRACEAWIKTTHPQWARWVAMMLWIGSPKDPGHLESLKYKGKVDSEEETRHIWDKIDMIGLPFQSPHIDDITSLLWLRDDDAMDTLRRGAFQNPEKLTYLELLLQCSNSLHNHELHSKDILLQLYEGAVVVLHAGFHKGRVPLGGIDWTKQHFNPILCMLALSDTQDMSDLTLNPAINSRCAERIWAICKAVKRQTMEFTSQFLDIVKKCRVHRAEDLAIVLEVTKEVLALPEDEMCAPLLRQLASRLQMLRDRMALHGSEERQIVAKQGQRICDLLQAKSARFISSKIHLRLLSCAQSSTGRRAAIGWLQMHVEL